MKVEFAKLDKKIQEGRCTIPQAVFVTLNPDDETFEQVVERQEKFLKLPEKIKNKLVASETSEKIKNVCAHYNMELLQMAPVARVIRSYYFGEVKLEDFAQIIEKESQIGKEEAQNIARYITERIISRDVEIRNTVRKEKLTIISAMEKYPEIKKQVLTSSFLNNGNNSSNPVIENWISDYFETVGAGNRDVMKRSSYLYHSKNAKSLSMADRQKLSQILKSLDEGFLLDVDMDKREIIFNLKPAENRNKLVAEINNNKNNINQKTSFPPKKEEVKNIQNFASAANKRFVDGFPAGDKKEEDKIIAKQVKESVVKLKDISNQSKSLNQNRQEGGFNFLLKAKKREEFDQKDSGMADGSQLAAQSSQKNNYFKLKQEDKKVENKAAQFGESGDVKTVINHVRGNSWDLGSAHFLKKEESIEEIGRNKKTFNFFGKKNKLEAEKDNTENDDKEGNIKFTSPQQLPVEKKDDLTSAALGDKAKLKNDRFSNFFGKIKPLE